MQMLSQKMELMGLTNLFVSFISIKFCFLDLLSFTLFQNLKHCHDDLLNTFYLLVYFSSDSQS